MNTETTLCRLNRKAAVCAAAMLALSVIAAASAFAGRPSEPAGITASETVRLADLDLSTPEGMTAARDRVHATARRLCFRLADPEDLSHQANYIKCVDDAFASAMLQLTGPGLGVLAQSRAGQRNMR
jgi:UrcA family protein